MRKSILTTIGALFLGAAATAVLMHSVVPDGPANAANSDTYKQLNLFGDVFDRVRSDYVEAPDDSKLIDAAISGMLSSLDPHSSYLNAKSFRDMQVQTRGEFGGLGIEVTMENGVVKVVTPIEGTPADLAGVKPGDLIIQLDKEKINGLTLGQAVEKMRGRVKTPLVLTIVRKGVDEPFEITVVRDIIRIKSVRFRQEKDVGYIRITTFTEQTQKGVEKAIVELKKSIGPDIKGYIVDLRNNPGGLLDQAISVSDTFLDRGEIVSTRGRNAEETQRYNARSGDRVEGKPIVVLINGGSASASEIVAGALQDHKRAKIIGTRSFGKGSVQTIIPLGGNGAIRLTTARYYTPSGQSIQAKGIIPDVVVEQEVPEDQKARTTVQGEASLRGHLEGEQGKPKSADDSTGSSAFVPKDKADDKQLAFALDMLRGVKLNTENATEKKTTIAN